MRSLNLIACHRNTSVSSDVGKQLILDPLGVSGENDLKGQRLEVRESPTRHRLQSRPCKRGRGLHQLEVHSGMSR